MAVEEPGKGMIPKRITVAASTPTPSGRKFRDGRSRRARPSTVRTVYALIK
jgi:hypothetical protein